MAERKDGLREQPGPFMLLAAPSVRGRMKLVKWFAEALGVRVKLTTLRSGEELLPRELETELEQADWTQRDVLVGAVRTSEQLRFNLKKRAYYVPTRFLPEEHPRIRYIALCERDADGGPGIRWVAQVQSEEERPRGEIPVTMRRGGDPRECYRYFTLRKWQQLPRTVTVQDAYPGKPQFTSRFLLEHCTASWQLFAVSTPEEYRLLRILDRAYGDLPGTGAYQLDRDRRLLVADGYFTVTGGQGEVLDQIAAANIRRSPAAAFARIRELLNKECI